MFINFKQYKNKKLKIVLLNVYGLNSTSINLIFKKLNCDFTCQVKDLTEKMEQNLTNILSNDLIITNRLVKRKYENLQKMKEVNNYRYLRHSYRLPVNGQNTKNNAKTKRK